MSCRVEKAGQAALPLPATTRRSDDILTGLERPTFDRTELLPEFLLGAVQRVPQIDAITSTEVALDTLLDDVLPGPGHDVRRLLLDGIDNDIPDDLLRIIRREVLDLLPHEVRGDLLHTLLGGFRHRLGNRLDNLPLQRVQEPSHHEPGGLSHP
ncbi:hypothetical protein [Streptomyces rimosus]|uniref:hypothetical protein n=1 Tax=Streptomyces rimosus TaxID=1927 RepID=UPI0006B26770|nr:hypothetical protein [Streptomyces rimosus]